MKLKSVYVAFNKHHLYVKFLLPLWLFLLLCSDINHLNLREKKNQNLLSFFLFFFYSLSIWSLFETETAQLLPKGLCKKSSKKSFMMRQKGNRHKTYEKRTKRLTKKKTNRKWKKKTEFPSNDSCVSLNPQQLEAKFYSRARFFVIFSMRKQEPL